ncbi:MAG: hypothetical protein ABFS35_17700 [Bacteroidota bacterium]
MKTLTLHINDNIYEDVKRFLALFSPEKLQIEIHKEKINETQKEPNDFQKFLMTAPTWSEKEYESFVETRKLFNQWEIK